MKLSDYEPYRNVVYTPYKGCDKKHIQYGVTTNANNSFIFVRFERLTCSLACSPEHLRYTTPKKKKSKKSVDKCALESAPEIISDDNIVEEIEIEI